jgi:hypothetical protein
VWPAAEWHRLKMSGISAGTWLNNFCQASDSHSAVNSFRISGASVVPTSSQPRLSGVSAQAFQTAQKYSGSSP